MDEDLVSRLQARIDFLEKVVDYLPFGVMVLDAQGKSLMMNRALETVSRVNREEVLGQFFHEKFPGLISRTELGFHYWSLVHEKKPFEYIFHDILPKLKISGIGLGAALPDDEGLLLAHHVSEQIREGKHTLAILATNLNESRAFLQNLIDSSPSAIFTVSPDGTIRSCNRTAAHIFGYSCADMLWKQISRLFDKKVNLEHLVSSTSIDSGIETVCRRKGGEGFPARLQISELEKGATADRETLFVITDISKEKDLEERLAVSEKLAIYSELIAGIFHQINNPLVGVVNFSSILLEKMAENDVNRQMVENMHAAALQCRKLISSMMQGFREPQSTFSKVILRDLLEHSIAESLRNNNALAGNVKLFNLIADLVPDVRGDALQLNQVFRNLVDNALQAMPEGGILEIGTDVDVTRDEIRIRLADTGYGISKENLTRIFTPFYSTKKNTGGGLGLSFAHRVITNHNGRIEVSSTEGKSTAFTVVLPVWHGEVATV